MSNSPSVLDPGAGQATKSEGITLVSFLTALSTSLVIFGIQTGLFLLLRNKLARIFKPKTYLAPERERTEPPPDSPWGMISALLRFKDREIIRKCGLDSYFFLRYLQTLLIIFIPMAFVLIPILVPLNYIGGISKDLNSNSTEPGASQDDHPTGLDTLAWGNVTQANYDRRWAHCFLAIAVVVWVCGVFFAELRIFIKIRQDWLTTAEHRLRASATTVLVSGIPEKWLSEQALRGLFDVFPGGLRNIWLTRDLTTLLDKIKRRDEVHKLLEGAETELIRMAKRKQLKRKEVDDRKARKAARIKGPTKEEKLLRQEQDDAAAKAQAESGVGLSSGDKGEVPHGVKEGLEAAAVADFEAEGERGDAEGGTSRSPTGDDDQGRNGGGPLYLAALGSGISKLTQGLGRGVNAVGKTGQTILGGAKTALDQVDDQLETTNGFVKIDEPSATAPPPLQRTEPSQRRVQLTDPPTHSTRSDTPAVHSNGGRAVQRPESMPDKQGMEMRPIPFGNTTRKAGNLEDMYLKEKVRWYEFWKPPPGGFASPLPQGTEDKEFPFKKETFWESVKRLTPFVGGDDEHGVEYPPAFDRDKGEDSDGGAEWEKWLKKAERPMHRLARFTWTPSWLPGLPLVNPKVDTIYWCREELARLNVEIEDDQCHPERYPLMNSAFIQFNHQVAAHMACQCVIHHIPKHMAPRTVEISPDDVIWDNMAINWFSQWARTATVMLIVAGMIILWAIPVTLTASLSRITELIDNYPWLSFLEENPVVFKAVKALAGVLPALVLALLLWLVPLIMDLLAGFKGAKTGSQKSETVQIYYFAFLFVQLVLVVTISNSVINTIGDIAKDPASVVTVLAGNVPKGSNYFFSYMILQALSTSSGTLLQLGALVNWYLIAKVFNSTARNKWDTNTRLPNVKWGSYFPVYTNFACIGLVYCVTAPLISIFAIITFSLLWIANRYSMLYVNRLQIDTGGLLYPRAINQTFTGLYIMEIVLIGLFFIAVDEKNDLACTAQGSIMVVALILTALYQLLLNRSFGPMYRYLPITFEDEAVLRDEAFERAQQRRFGLIDEDNSVDSSEEGGELAMSRSRSSPGQDTAGTRAKGLGRKTSKLAHLVPGLVQAGSWARRGGKVISDNTIGLAGHGVKHANKYRLERRQKDLEAQRAIGEALYGGFHDEIEDLTPDERDVLVRRAFMHSALRARRPTVWIPRDDIGVSDDEIRRTREFSDHIWISNEGTALDSKVRVVYGRAPPDFSEVDLISL